MDSYNDLPNPSNSWTKFYSSKVSAATPVQWIQGAWFLLRQLTKKENLGGRKAKVFALL